MGGPPAPAEPPAAGTMTLAELGGKGGRGVVPVGPEKDEAGGGAAPEPEGRRHLARSSTAPVVGWGRSARQVMWTE